LNRAEIKKCLFRKWSISFFY